MPWGYANYQYTRTTLGPPLALYSKPPFRLHLETRPPTLRRNQGFWSASSRLFVWFGLVPSQSDSPYLIEIS